MKGLYWLGAVLALAAISAAQDRVFDWVHASDEAAQLDPMEYHAGRIYRPSSDGGNIHIDILSKMPVTVAMAPNDQWTAATRHAHARPRMEFLCMREHVVNTTYECHLPDGRPMVLLIRDERMDDRISSQIAVAAFGHGSGRFIAPNDLRISYYR